MLEGIKKLVGSIIDAVFVDKFNCIACDEELRDITKYGICKSCREKLEPSGDRICQKCGKKMNNEAKYCLTCQNYDQAFDIARSSFVYDGIAKKLVHGLKFGGKKYVAKYLAEFYVDAYFYYEMSADVVVAVPISKKRRKERAFNQAEEIAKVVAERLGIDHVASALEKTKELLPQEAFGGKERIENVKGAFSLGKNKDLIKGKRVLLIDDILTTGATASAASLELKKVAREVSALVFASPINKIESVTKDVSR